MTKRLLASNSGMTLIEVMIAVAISSVVILASLSVGQMSLQTQAQNNVSFQADIIRRNMVALISSDAAWKNTVAGTCLTNAGASCSTNGNPNGPALGPQSISIIKNGAGGNAYVVSSPNGFNNDGSPCTGIGYTCPLTYAVTWTPQCGSGVTCLGSTVQVQVAVTPTYHPPTATGAQKLIFNAANYGFTLYR